MKFYIVLRSSLYAGLMAAQACHAMRAFIGEYPHIEAEWHAASNNIAILEHVEPETIAQRMEAAGYRVSRFHEPDRGGELTAIAIEPNDGRLLSSLPLAGKRERGLLAAALRA